MKLFSFQKKKLKKEQESIMGHIWKHFIMQKQEILYLVSIIRNLWLKKEHATAKNTSSGKASSWKLVNAILKPKVQR